MASADSKGQTVFINWWNALRAGIWAERSNKVSADMKKKVPVPEAQTIMEWLKKDTAYLTSQRNMVTTALQSATAEILKMQEAHKNNGLEWYRFDHPAVFHLLGKANKSMKPLNRENLHTGGDGDIVNAIHGDHGPSWRMIVHLTANTEAYGLYPGGQSGNPGSKFYDTMIDSWVKGDYYKLWFMHDADKKDKNVKWTMKFSSK